MEASEMDDVSDNVPLCCCALCLFFFLFFLLRGHVAVLFMRKRMGGILTISWFYTYLSVPHSLYYLDLILSVPIVITTVYSALQTSTFMNRIMKTAEVLTPMDPARRDLHQ